MMYLQPKKQSLVKQQGSALMLALFVMIVLMLLGSALVKILSTSSETIAQEVIGTRALMAASAGMQAHLQKTFPLNTPNPQACPADYSYDLSGVDGLKHCWAHVTCIAYSTPGTESYYRFVSQGDCGSSAIDSESIGIVRSSRTLQVEARNL